MLQTFNEKYKQNRKKIRKKLNVKNAGTGHGKMVKQKKPTHTSISSYTDKKIDMSFLLLLSAWNLRVSI